MLRRFFFPLLLACGWPAQGWAQSGDASTVEFFESRIRPVLVEHCYECHNSHGTAEGGLRLDFRRGLRMSLTAAADSPSGKIAYSVDASQLLKVLRHEIEGMEMPQDSPQLSAAVIRDFESWVQQGAVDPRDMPADNADGGSDFWQQELEDRKDWWSFQPIPEFTAANAPSETVDEFIDAKIADVGLPYAEEAEAGTLVRRLYFALAGLPPKPDQIQAYLNDSSPDKYERLVDHLLASEQFGERWARHWMDWIRYAESHGSEGDPAIRGAYLYRDYLIRALNNDVGYDQLVREHIAGDLLAQPRWNADLQVNESLIGTAHLRMVFHGFAPTDALEEKVRFTDDVINTVSKAFLGLTVSCARCHNHKFDAISQEDYYALYGIFASVRPGRRAIDTQELQEKNTSQILMLKQQLREALADRWQEQIERGLNAEATLAFFESLLPAHDADAIESPHEDAWSALEAAYRQNQNAWNAFRSADSLHSWDFSESPTDGGWRKTGFGLSRPTSAPGEFTVAHQGPTVLTNILPGGVYSNLISDKHPARIESPYFTARENSKLWLRMMGSGGATSRYAVQDYPRSGTVYPVRTIDSPSDWKSEIFDLHYWSGDRVHAEITTAKDGPLLGGGQDRSWFGICEARVFAADAPHPPQQDLSFLGPLMRSDTPVTADPKATMRTRLQSALHDAIVAWKARALSNDQALLLDRAVATDLLDNRRDQAEKIDSLVSSLRGLEAEIASPRRAPTVEEAGGADHPLLVRGDHRRPAHLVPRRFLEAIDASPYRTDLSGRLEFADDLLRTDNPFTARVAVNRIWHHLFGTGLVSTPDNFGKLGAAPSHPELLDYLAWRLRQNDWSMKSIIREIVLSQAWRRSSTPTPESSELDPKNIYLSHMNVRRLDAESIRDSLLEVSNRLDKSMYGPSVAGDSQRRSVYVRVIRNRLDPFLRTFDAPVPFSATGRRDVTNVPAQALMMMNLPRIRQLASDFATLTQSQPPDQRIQSMWSSALGRGPTESELDLSRHLLDTLDSEYHLARQQVEQLTLERAQLQDERQALLESVAANAAAVEPSSHPEPLATWNFDVAPDQQDTVPLTLHGSAKIKDGALLLGKNGWASTAPMARDLSAKSLEVVVRVADLNQRGGGVMTIQDLAGNQFDSLVFAEQSASQWMAGSDFFRRTQAFEGPSEDLVGDQKVHLVLVYDDAGQIALYRNGQLYGSPYKTELLTFPAAQWQVLFGLRHGTTSDRSRLFRGAILEARLYDYALDANAVLATAWSNETLRPSLARSLLTPQQLESVQAIEEKMRKLDDSMRDLQDIQPDEAWVDLAHSLFNMKEFIYVR